MIKVISFDIWKTLIRSNPAYVQLRAEMIAEALGCKDRVAEVKEAVRQACNELDSHTDMTGIQHGVTERLVRTAELVGAERLSDKASHTLVHTLHHAHVANLPILMEADLPDTLSALRDHRLRIGVISNTGMSEGRTLRAIFDQIGIGRYVNYFIFSDEVGVAKPDPEIFDHLTAIASVDPSSVIHVGDNLLADVEGAKSKGLHARLYAPGQQPGASIITSHTSLLSDVLLDVVERV